MQEYWQKYEFKTQKLTWHFLFSYRFGMVVQIYVLSLSQKYLNESCCSRWDFAVWWLNVINGVLCVEPALFQTWSKLLAKWSHGGDASCNSIKQSGWSPALDGQGYFLFITEDFSLVAKQFNVFTHSWKKTLFLILTLNLRSKCPTSRVLKTELDST